MILKNIYVSCFVYRLKEKRFDTISACDGQTDGIAVGNTALSMFL